MIVVDLEFSGLNLLKCGIWQIGAMELENPKNVFFDECRIDDDDEISELALKVTGKTEAELRDRAKQGQKQLLEKFFRWCEKSNSGNFACQGPQWDMALLVIKANKYGLKFPMHHRAFDLHSMAQEKYVQLNKKLLFKDNRSDMDLSNVLAFCGIPDERMQIKEGKIAKKGNPHNALEDAKMTAECLSRIIYGKPLLDEYKKFKIPEYLKIK